MNFLVDTCVLSELAKRKPDANVVRWMKRNCTTLVHGMTVLTRNVADMEHTGARTVNPFDVRA